MVALIVVLVTASVVVGWLEISINLAPWRSIINAKASQLLGRPVHINGTLELVPTLAPTLRVSDVRVDNPAGFSRVEFLTLQTAHLRIDLVSLFKSEMRIQQVGAHNMKLYLERTGDGRANWQLATPSSNKEPDGKLANRAPKALEVRKLTVEGVHIEYRDMDTTAVHDFHLDRLDGVAAEQQAIELSARGLVEQRFPYTLSIRTGPLAGLYAAQPWPMKASFTFLGTKIELNGTLGRPLAGEMADIAFDVRCADLSAIEKLLQRSLPQVGASRLSGRGQWDRGLLRLTDLHGVMGASELAGDLALDLRADRPRVTGTLSLPVLDLQPFLVEREDSVDEPRTDLVEAYARLERKTLRLSELRLVDADVNLQVVRWLGIPGQVRDSELRVRIKGGVLQAPIRAVVAEVPFEGRVDLDAAGEIPSFGLELGAHDTQLGRLAELFAGAQGVQGRLRRIGLNLSGRGETLPAIVKTLAVNLMVEGARLSYGNMTGGRPVEFLLDHARIMLPSGGRLTGSLRGALLGEPVTAEFSGGDLPTLRTAVRWPIELRAKGSGARIHVQGVVAAPELDSGSLLYLSMEAKRAGDLGRWLGLSPKASAPLLIEGVARIESDEWLLDLGKLQLGRTSMTSTLARSGIGSRPLVQATLRLDNLDVAQLDSMLPPPKKNERPVIDIPILPAGIDLTDADVQVNARRIDLRPVPVSNVAFSGRIREGRMQPSPFTATIAQAVFQGAVAIDLRGKLPEASLWVSATQVDVGALLQQLRVMDDLQANVDVLRVQLLARGQRLGEMLEKSAIEGNLEGGQLVLQNSDRGFRLPIGLKKGTISAGQGERVAVNLDGTIDATPIVIRIASGTLSDFIKTSSHVPLTLAAQAAGATLKLEGKVELPMNRRTGELELKLGGARLDSLNELVHAALPPWGPWSLRGRFRAVAGGYQVPDLNLRIGQSHLSGRGTFTTAAAKPGIDIALTARRVQLDDFEFGVWSPFEKKPPVEEQSLDIDAMRAKVKDAAATGQRLLSPQVLQRQDVVLALDIDEVLSGNDQLGNGRLRARLEQGRLAVDPVEVEIPGGSARVSFAYQPGAQDVAIEANARVERFDYGVLARRIKPDVDVQGLFSLNLELKSRAPRLEQVMQHADGRIDFAVWPRNLKAGVFDLWAVNLFLALLPAVDPATESRVNCAMGRFDLRDGKLTHETILLDTSRMRVSGEGRVDFATEALAFRLAPKAKNPQFFSLATPVAVSGTITDFKIGVAASDVFGTAARFLGSIFVAPLQKLTQTRLPRDGADVCDAGLRAAGAR